MEKLVAFCHPFESGILCYHLVKPLKDVTGYVQLYIYKLYLAIVAYKAFSVDLCSFL